jgi:hypothetical protein
VPIVDDKQADQTVSIFFKVPRMPFPFASPIGLRPDKQPGAKLRTIAKTSPRSTTSAGPGLVLQPKQTWKPEGPEGERTVAVLVEGTLGSAFPSGGAPKSATGRLLVVASSQFLANPYARVASPADRELAAAGGTYLQRYVQPMLIVFKNTA